MQKNEFENVQPPVKSASKEANNWAMFLHLSMLITWSMVGIVAPIIIWQIKKDEFPEIDAHGRNAANFMLSMMIYGFIAIPLCFLGIGFLLLPVLVIAAIVLPIIAGIKANDGECWPYPLMIRFF